MEHLSKSEQEEKNSSPSPRPKVEPVTSSSSKEPSKKPVRIVMKHPSATKLEESTDLQPQNDQQIKESESSRHEREPEPVVTSNDSLKQSDVEMKEYESDSTDDYFLSAEELVQDPVSCYSTETDDKRYVEHYADNVGDIESACRPKCNQYGKSFHSDKALFGDMRLHSHKSSVKKQVKDEALTPSSIIYQNLKWRITGKRGRQKKDASDSQSEDVTEVENTHEDSKNLNVKPDEGKLQIGGDDGNVVAMTVVQEVKSSKEDRTSVIEFTLKNVSENNVKSLLGHIDEVVGITSAQAKVSTTLVGNSNATISNEEPNVKRIKLEHSSDGKGSHVCDICNKSFPTHQALGGHATSHNRGKHKQDEGGDQTSKKSKKKTGDSEHKCSKCGAVYATGQSLGGHMRKHYDPDKIVKSSDGSPSQSAKEDTVKDIGESSTINTMQETVQLPTVNEHSGNVINELSSTNTMEQTGAMPIANEDTDRVPSESSSGNAIEERLASDVIPALDLTEMPEGRRL